MTINSAMLAGVTGLVSNSSALAAISDNIANSNTVGYKRSGVSFSSLVNSNSMSSYAAGGVATHTSHMITQQGTLQSSSSPTDLAINGNGFFVTTNHPTGVLAGDARYFTRAGSFNIDADGYLKSPVGLFLQGWAADANGNVTPDSANLTRLSSINVLNVANTATATTQGAINGNLNADQAVNTATSIYNADVNPAITPAVNVNMAEYANNTTTGVKPDFSITMPVSDSKGGQRNLTIDFLKSATPNQWHAEVRSDPANLVQTDPLLTPGLIASGIVAFNPDGSLNTTKTTLPSTLAIGASSATAPASGSGEAGVQWSNAIGVNAQSIALDITKMTQFSAVSNVNSVSTNGTAFGAMSGVSIDDQGFVTAVYDNGTTRRIAQVALATVPNPDGLTPANGNAYQVSLDSGGFTLKPPGSTGTGKIAPSSLEASTVDLSAEFTGLITTQRAYSASSKIITTADQMLQELIDIKR